MKPEMKEIGLVTVAMPAEARRDSLMERRSAAHLEDPTRRWHHPGGQVDYRFEVEAGRAPQRNRARMNESRTMVDSHVRRGRRAPAG